MRLDQVGRLSPAVLGPNAQCAVFAVSAASVCPSLKATCLHISVLGFGMPTVKKCTVWQSISLDAVVDIRRECQFTHQRKGLVVCGW